MSPSLTMPGKSSRLLQDTHLKPPGGEAENEIIPLVLTFETISTYSTQAVKMGAHTWVFVHKVLLNRRRQL